MISPGGIVRCDWLRSKPKQSKFGRELLEMSKSETNFWLRSLAVRLSAETKITVRKDSINKIICKLSCTLEEWSGFFPEQIHHMNVVILEPKPKKILKLHRNIDKSCIKKQKWHEIINHYAWNRSASWPLNVRPAAKIKFALQHNRTKDHFRKRSTKRYYTQWTSIYTLHRFSKAVHMN